MTYTLHLGDCLDVMRGMPANSVDTVVTDPPYGLAFMGKGWDFGVPGVAFWAEALRVAKPGAHLLAFGGTRTFHRLTCAIEDAGWEVRDCVMWLYGSGFPKSHDISKAIDKAAGAVREVVGTNQYASRRPNPMNGTAYQMNATKWDISADLTITAPATPAAQQWHGWGTALKPAWEPVILAMKPLDGTFANNAQVWGCAGLNVDGARIGTDTERGNRYNGKPPGGTTAAFQMADKKLDVWNAPAGRWPANLVLDEDAAAALDAQSGVRTSGRPTNGNKPTTANAYGQYAKRSTVGHSDTGGASRFFYVAKASRAERNAGLEGMEARSNAERDGRNQYKNGAARNGSGNLVNGDGHILPQQNHHPTVKPLALMRYLVRLTSTPTGGVVLDPFCGSGTTGVACMMEGRSFVGIELDSDYLEIARRRIESVQPALVGA